MWILFFAAGSLISARHIPLFIVIALPLVGLALNEQWIKFTAGQPRSSMPGVLRDISEKAGGNLQADIVERALQHAQRTDQLDKPGPVLAHGFVESRLDLDGCGAGGARKL